jgi:hypothetical protein
MKPNKWLEAVMLFLWDTEIFHQISGGGTWTVSAVNWGRIFSQTLFELFEHYN